MDAREIWECINCDGLFYADENCKCDAPNWNGPASQQALFDAGFTIMSKADVEAVRAEAVAEYKAAIASLKYVTDADIEAVRDDAIDDAARHLEGWGDMYGDNAARAVRSLKSKEGKIDS